jgi:DNA-binding MarR family transcriptional regulator
MNQRLPKRQDVVKDQAPRSPAGEAFTGFLMRVFPLDHRFTASGEALAKRAGQTLARWLVLETVEPGPATVAEIARRLGLARQGVQRLADLLVDDGLARYEDNPRHRRAKLLRITTNGLRTLRRIQAAQREWAERLGAEIGLEELERASALLDHMLALVNRELPALRAGGKRRETPRRGASDSA